MTPTLESLLQSAAPPATPVDPSSRYYGIATAKQTIAGREVVYLQRRFVPPPPDDAGALPVVSFHQGVDRLDRLANKYLGNAGAFWQLCDANRVMDPAELEQGGHGIRIPWTSPFAGGPNG
jgi:hypothetical protein